MPKRTDIKTILIIGSGPIVIGQGCEFDYSGTQACKALREEGYQVVLVNSNPATIMTDPATADRTYIEPITPEAVEKIIIKERGGPYHIDVLLPTLGGQTGLNCACELFDSGVLAKYDIEMIGATREVIHRAEDRQKFKDIIDGLGLGMAKAGTAKTMDEAWAILEFTGLPAIIRPAFTLGGTGGGIAYNREEFEDIARRGIDASMNSQILIDQSLIGWKEYELEVMRDMEDNVVIICSIENIDAMGVHTGDSVTVAPAQTLTDKEYQRMRDASLAIIRAIGVETGGSNIQFAVNPANGDLVVIEMNPRVSRSSALASKATGFPIAKIAAKLAVGYSLWELPNDITGETVACFEPTIDYVVTKFPRWTFEKFPEADETLTTQMKSVGEAMSIGRTFKESFQKCVRSMEVKRFGLGFDHNDKYLLHKMGKRLKDGEAIAFPIDESTLNRKLSVPAQGRLYYVRYALKMGWDLERINKLTHIDLWFLDQFKQLVDFEDVLESYERLEDLPVGVLREAKQLGYSDAQLAMLYLGKINSEHILKVRAYRDGLGVRPVYKLVDTCGGEFDAVTPYYYSTYETPYRMIDDAGVCVDVVDDEIRITEDKQKIIILGGGPNRIGQGIEFDYCCVQAAYAANELGFESVMINSNPETVSTDYDTSDMLFFEPLTLEDVLNVCERVNGKGLGEAGGLLHGVIVQFGGQTPLNLAHGLEAAGVKIIGTSVDSIDLAEDRKRFQELCHELDINQPLNGIALNVEEAVAIAEKIGYPVLVRPSFVLGGRAMEIVYDAQQLHRYFTIALGASDLADQPILVDKFLSEAIECDVDVVGDYGSGAGEGSSLICGVMEHIEEAGIHSGDSACTIPPYSLPGSVIDELIVLSRQLAKALCVSGLMNVQWAITKPSDKNGGKHKIYILEVNPRASRTVPFVSKATGVSWARLAAKVMAGVRLSDLGVCENLSPSHTFVKESVFPFAKFPNTDVILGPEMRSTGEVMGGDASFAVAFAKGQMAVGQTLPMSGNVFLSLRQGDKDAYMLEVVKTLVAEGFTIYSTPGTHQWLADQGVCVVKLNKISEGRPHAIDLIKNRELDLILNTPTRKGSDTDEGKLRSTAVRFNVPMITTTTGAAAVVRGISALRKAPYTVKCLQEYYPVYHTGKAIDVSGV